MEHQPPKVSVCIVTYNQEQYIEECLQSVVNQEVDFPIEVIISDDCSTDRTPAIIQKFADKYPFIKPVLRDKNIGALKNYVETHSLAKGEYVCHLDGDDRWLNGKLKSQKEFLGNNAGCSVCWTLSNLFDDDGKYKKANNGCLDVFKQGKVYLEDALKIGAVAVNSSIMYKRKYYPELDKNKNYIDLFIAWSLLEHGYGKILPYAFVDYRVNAKGAITKNSNIKAFYLQHGKDFLYKDGINKNNLFFLFFTNCLVSLKNLEAKNFINFLFMSIRTFNFKGFISYRDHLKKLDSFKGDI